MTLKEALNCDDGEDNTLSLGFADPGTLDSNPGWPLRNLLAVVSKVRDNPYV